MDVLLNNIDKSKQIEESSVRLQDQASRFDQRATELKRKERSKMYRTWACMACSVVIVGAVILLVVLGMGGSSSAPAAAPTVMVATISPSVPATTTPSSVPSTASVPVSG